MARSKQQQALSKIAQAWGVSEQVARQRVEALPHSRVRDRYRAAETRVSRELGVESIYAPQSRRPKSVQTELRSAPSSWSWTPVKVETRVQPQHDYTPSSRPRQFQTVSSKPYIEREPVDKVVSDFNGGLVATEYAKDRYNRFRESAISAANKYINQIREKQAEGKFTAEQASKAIGNIHGQLPPDLVKALTDYPMGSEAYNRIYTDMNRFDALIASDASVEKKGELSWTVKDGRVVNRFTDVISSEAVESTNKRISEERESIAQERYGMSWGELPKDVRYVLESRYDLKTVSPKLSAQTGYLASTGLYELSDVQFMENYIQALQDSEVNPKIIEEVTGIIQDIIDIKPGALRDIIKSGADEVQIKYMYRDDTSDTPYHEQFTARENNIKLFWANQKKKLFGEESSTQ